MEFDRCHRLGSLPCCHSASLSASYRVQRTGFDRVRGTQYALHFKNMNQIKLNFEFNASVEKVWAVLADVTQTPEWVHGVKTSVANDAGAARKGFCWEEKVSIDGQNADIQNEFIEWTPHQNAAIKTTLPMGGWMRKVFSFADQNGKTNLEIDMTWNLGILEMLAGPEKVHAALEKSLHKTLEAWQKRA